jgi:4-hydroxy-tetrahydrodipicolinate synthase
MKRFDLDMKQSSRYRDAARGLPIPRDQERRVSTTSALRDSADDSRKQRVTGILPPIPTPLHAGRLDLDSLRKLLDHLLESVDGVVIGGSTGEAASLSIAEREDVIRTVAGHLAGTGRAIVASVADNSLEHSRRLSAVAGDVGADLLILSCPSYYPNDYGMLEAYFGAVAEFASSDLCLYDNPYVSKTWLTADEIHRLAAAIPRLTHIKMTDIAIGKVNAVLAAGEMTVLVGEDSVLWHQLVGGAEGVMSAIPMIYPQTTARMWKAFIGGRHEEAFVEYRNLAPFINCGIHGDDYVSVVKTVLQHHGVIESAEVRLPLLPIAESRRAEVLAILE